MCENFHRQFSAFQWQKRLVISLRRNIYKKGLKTTERRKQRTVENILQYLLIYFTYFFITLGTFLRLHHFISSNPFLFQLSTHHNFDVIMTTMAYQITSLMVVYSIAYSGANQRKHQSSTSLAFLWGIHRVSNAENDSIWWRHHA